MEQAVDHVASEFTTVRTGRANPQILHRINIDYYGTADPSAAAGLVFRPRAAVCWSSSLTTIVDGRHRKSDQSASDLGLNPSNDGNVIRLAFPPLTEERRRELIKMVRHMAEEGRVAVRNVRRHGKDDIEALMERSPMTTSAGARRNCRT